MRIIERQKKRIKRVSILSGVLLSNLNEVKRTFIKVIRIYRREGISGVVHRLQLVQSDQYVNEMESIADYHLSSWGN